MYALIDWTGEEISRHSSFSAALAAAYRILEYHVEFVIMKGRRRILEPTQLPDGRWGLCFPDPSGPPVI